MSQTTNSQQQTSESTWEKEKRMISKAKRYYKPNNETRKAYNEHIDTKARKIRWGEIENPLE